MRVHSVTISNFRGIKEKIEILLGDFVCIVGKNDVGKSTILKALDAFFNDVPLTINDRNVESADSMIVIEVAFHYDDSSIVLDETIETSFQDEELLDENNLLRIRKVWDISQKKPKAKWFIRRKVYEPDFFLMTEKNLMQLCQNLGIRTQKGNGEQYNNKEKRQKIRSCLIEAKAASAFGYLELQTTGTSRPKKIYDALLPLLPVFEYFKADSSLSDSDASVQKYFKDRALNVLKNKLDTTEIEDVIRTQIGESLTKITKKINAVLSAEEQIEAQVNFDWSKIVSTSFNCKANQADIPLSSRGDGFRRITMLSYFEMLSEERNERNNVLFGFEEPETFLHPETQKLLFKSLKGMADNGYQVFLTTHSPNIVAQCDISHLVQVLREEGAYRVHQGAAVSIRNIIEDLGIKPDHSLLQLFNGNTKALLLVEGADDVKAITHVAQVYKRERKIARDFQDCGVLLIPVGGCDSIKHWCTFDIIQKLGKPYFIFLDSDKVSETGTSPNQQKLQSIPHLNNHYAVTRKREIENYIPSSYFATLNPPIHPIQYGDWDDVKDICKNHPDTVRLGGKKVCDKHFSNLTYEQLRSTFCPTDVDADDEFLYLHGQITGKL